VVLVLDHVHYPLDTSSHFQTHEVLNDFIQLEPKTGPEYRGTGYVLNANQQTEFEFHC
jgi:hypothetical protein